MSEDQKSCQNCNRPIPEDGRFCPECGQSTLDIRQPVVPVLKQLFGEAFDWDGRLLTTLRHMMCSPGRLTREYTLGHRVRFTPPLRVYLAVSVLFFFVFPVIIPLSQAENTVAPSDQTAENYSKMMFLLLPVFALLVKLFHKRDFYMQHLVFSMHLFSAMFIVFAVMLSMENLADQSYWWVAAQVSVFGYMVWYLITALKVSFQQTWSMALLKSAGLVALFLPALSGAIHLASRI
ncbi:MAG TPA: DUF3667 domain-containing protein [Xanthomonadales bacterium]|nr:DUF3667 domain-containing protein [Xanthomonadales bacterium]